jgi:hypothetical protein
MEIQVAVVIVQHQQQVRHEHMRQMHDQVAVQQQVINIIQQKHEQQHRQHVQHDINVHQVK